MCCAVCNACFCLYGLVRACVFVLCVFTYLVSLNTRELVSLVSFCECSLSVPAIHETASQMNFSCVTAAY